MTDPMHSTRRQALAALAITALASRSQGAEARPAGFQLATFDVDVTPPIGHPLMGGGIAPASKIVDRLAVRGVVIVGDELPLMIAAIDWCEIRNDAYTAWRSALAEAVGTTPSRILLTSIHQHDTPIADLEAERLLELNKSTGRICDLSFHEKVIQKAKNEVRAAAKTLQTITHIGAGTAIVNQVASNRRYLGSNGQPRFDRMSATKDPAIRSAPEGTIDPKLRALSFWNESKPIAVINNYATHPMSYYGRGEVSDDFVGLARRRRQQQEPTIFQIYSSGCSGNVTAGKYNDGATENREVLATRMERAMAEAWKSTQKYPLTDLSFRSVPLSLALRTGPGFSLDELDQQLKNGPRPFDQCLAALGLSRAIHARDGATIDLPCIDFGRAQYLVLPGESYVEFQLLAASIRPDDLVVVAGYGECSPGYIPTDTAFAENDTNLRDWCWVAPGSERRMIDAIRRVLARE